MIQITYQLVCDNCTAFKEYKKNFQESFVIEILKEGWFVEKSKHFCSKKCLDEYKNKEF